MKKILIFLSIAFALGVVMSGAGGATPQQDRGKVHELMHRKLERSQKVLEGLALEDFGMIEENAEALTLLSQAAEWQIFPSSEYKQYSSEFRRSANALVQMAKDKNIDGATLKYVELTTTCVNCHKYVRTVRMARLDTR